METRRIFISIMMLVMLSTGLWAYADVNVIHGFPVIEGSYIVTFKEDAGLVLPANAANRIKGTIPFGQHSTGQSKHEIAAMLGTTGEVVLILDAINAVNIKMDAKEADRLSRDKRVLRVTQSVVPTPYTVQDATYNWGLDRLDSGTPNRNNAYSCWSNHLDSGFRLGFVQSECSSRIRWSRNYIS